MEKKAYSITKTSALTGITHTRKYQMTEEQYEEYMLPPKQRRALQLVFPELSKDDREFLISGITPEEWDQEFGGEDE